MDRLIIFVILSLPVILISWRTLFNIKSHGFYRFFDWECIVWLAVSNYKFWFDNPFCVKQIFAWIFLLTAGYLVIAGVLLLKKARKPEKNRDEKTLYQFEKTAELIDTGIFKFIRHPLYSSLLFLTWGIFLKNITPELFIISLVSSIFLYVTAKFDEKECIEYFGEEYKNYMRKSKMFIPFLI